MKPGSRQMLFNFPGRLSSPTLARACAGCDMHTCGDGECGSAPGAAFQSSSDTQRALKFKPAADGSDIFVDTNKSVRSRSGARFCKAEQMEVCV